MTDVLPQTLTHKHSNLMENSPIPQKVQMLSQM